MGEKAFLSTPYWSTHRRIFLPHTCIAILFRTRGLKMKMKKLRITRSKKVNICIDEFFSIRSKLDTMNFYFMATLKILKEP